MCCSAVNDGSCSPWVMCSCSVVRGNQIRDRAPPPKERLPDASHTRHNPGGWWSGGGTGGGNRGPGPCPWAEETAET